MILINCTVLLILRGNPEFLTTICYGPTIDPNTPDGGAGESHEGKEGGKESKNLEGNNNNEIGSGNGGKNSSKNSMKDKLKSKQDDEGSFLGGVMVKIREYRQVAFEARDSLEGFQNGVLKVNITLMKIRGLYQWENPAATLQLLGALILGFIVYATFPFRFLFPFMVLDFFSKKWQTRLPFSRRLLKAVYVSEDRTRPNKPSKKSKD